MKHDFLPITAILFGFGFPLLAQAQAQLSGPQLLEALQQGGLVLYVRHGATDFGQTDFWQQGGHWSRETLSDCSRQRNLSAAGREQVRKMGRAITRLKLSWGAVLASPYCRTRETAEAAFGKAEISWDLFYHQAARSRRPEDGEAILAAVRRLLSTPPAPGTNTVLVSHGGNLSAVAGVFLAEGETAVFRPGAGGAYTLIARIMPEDWARLAFPPTGYNTVRMGRGLLASAALGVKRPSCARKADVADAREMRSVVPCRRALTPPVYSMVNVPFMPAAK